MLSGPIVAMVWEGRDAVKTGRSKYLFLSIYKQTDSVQLFLVQPTLLPLLPVPSAATMPLMSVETCATAPILWTMPRRKSLFGSSQTRSRAGSLLSLTGFMRSHRCPRLVTGSVPRQESSSYPVAHKIELAMGSLSRRPDRTIYAQ